MNRKIISVIIVVIILAIIGMIIVDYSGKQPDKLGNNPYEYNVEQFRAVDPELIGYRETGNMPVRGYTPGGMDVKEGVIWLTGTNTLQAVTTAGVQLMKKEIEGSGLAIEVTGDAVFIGFEDHIKKYTTKGDLIAVWDIPGSKCVFTSLAANDSILYVADAGNRRVLRYDFEGVLLGEFRGKSEGEAGHGFIVPSANFDLVVNSFDELWVVNPGMHALENYSNDGQLRGYWQNSSMKIDGFTGCCNPAQIAVLEDGSFVTSEKGMVRIKVYDSSGKLQSVVAEPGKFNEEGKAPEVKADENGVIYALDFETSMVRIFEKI
ncbi:MAG: hypothetical protein WD052_04415 [Bacteroidales bacterium]